MNNNSWQGNRSRYHYLLAELLRLNGKFEQAAKVFALVDSEAKLPIDLLENQKNLANRENSEPILLSNKQVQEIFFPKLITVLATDKTEEEQATQFTEKPPSAFGTANNNFLDRTERQPNILPPKRVLNPTV